MSDKISKFLNQIKKKRKIARKELGSVSKKEQEKIPDEEIEEYFNIKADGIAFDIIVASNVIDQSLP